MLSDLSNPRRSGTCEQETPGCLAVRSSALGLQREERGPSCDPGFRAGDKDRVNRIRCQSPADTPKTKPAGARKRVPHRWSSQDPTKPGRTISIATDVILDTHSMATATGWRLSGEEFIFSARRPSHRTGQAAPCENVTVDLSQGNHLKGANLIDAIARVNHTSCFFSQCRLRFMLTTV